MNARHIDTAKVAKLIRAELKANFPTVKFTVRSKRYAGGSSIDVDWIDGPTTENVKGKIGFMHGASFDGMYDLKEYHDSAYKGEPVHYGNDYLFCNRNCSETTLRAAYDWFMTTWAASETNGFQWIPSTVTKYGLCSAYFHGTWDQERIVRNHIAETEL